MEEIAQEIREENLSKRISLSREEKGDILENEMEEAEPKGHEEREENVQIMQEQCVLLFCHNATRD